jgi:hypothetical protein
MTKQKVKQKAKFRIEFLQPNLLQILRSVDSLSEELTIKRKRL